MKRSLIYFLIFFAYCLHGQNTNNENTSDLIPVGKYWIYFTNKSNSPYTKSNPAEFLTQRSIERREKMNIKITEQDLPVNETYIRQIKNAGVEIVTTSRWLNAVSVNIYDEEHLVTISQLPFVKEITPVKKYFLKVEEPPVLQDVQFRITGDENIQYGAATNQFTMINGDFLHSLNYRGQGMIIAVLDGGFAGVDTGAGFASLWEKEQVLGTYNFPDNNENVFFSSLHGTNVLSIMAADIPNVYVGSAPDANYYLFRTEVVDSERVAEEDFWLAAAEQADFLGADIINSSLGYTTFDNPLEDHTYADMDGNTTIVTRAADWAASKGILVCNSAGNAAQSAWHFIGAPADGDSVFSIGAVDEKGVYAAFSSQGPTSDGRLKPNIAVQGSNFPVVNPNGNIAFGGGTSYASPLAAGTSACLWQAFPAKTNMQIIDAIQRSASQFFNPDYLIGNGIPDFAFAYFLLRGSPNEIDGEGFSIIPNPVDNNLTIVLYERISDNALIEIYDVAGKRMFSYKPASSENDINVVYLEQAQDLSSGVYLVRFVDGDIEMTEKLFVK